MKKCQDMGEIFERGSVNMRNISLELLFQKGKKCGVVEFFFRGKNFKNHCNFLANQYK